MENLSKPVPRPITLGYRDVSRKQLPVVPEQLPTHLPHFYVLAERGGPGAKLNDKGGFQRILGSDTFEVTSRYFTHQTLGALSALEHQQVFIERVKPVNAKTATLRLSFEMVEDEVETYERDPVTGEYAYQANGEPNVVPGVTLNGYRGRWLVTHVKDLYDDEGRLAGDDFGTAKAYNGGDLSTASKDSRVIPIMDFRVSSFGDWGNRVGIRWTSPITRGRNAADGNLMKELNSYVFRVQLVERGRTSTDKVITTIGGDQEVELCLRSGAETGRGMSYDMEEVFIPRYREMTTPGRPEVEGPFEEYYFYQTNYENAVTLLIGKENLVPGADRYTDEQLYLFNPFSGSNMNGVQYHSFVMSNDAPGSMRLNGVNTMYASNGSDGDINPKAYDDAVYQLLDQWGEFDQPTQALNWAKYPVSDYYDTGFSLETKKKFLDLMSRRKDIKVWVCPWEAYKIEHITFDPTDPLHAKVMGTGGVGEVQGTGHTPTTYLGIGEKGTMESWVPNTPNDLITEEANIMMLSMHGRSHVDSALYGTQAFRFFIQGQTGKFIQHTYRGWSSLIMEVISKRALYMGSGDGNWRRGTNPQIAPNNQLKSFKEVNHSYRQFSSYDKAWSAGSMWVQDFDRSSLFFPAFHSAHAHSDSVLLSMGMVDVLIESTKACLRSWRMLVGRDDLTEIEFKAESDLTIKEDLSPDRFDDRFVFDIETVISEDDSARGYTWSAIVRVYGNKMKLVASFTVEAADMGDLQD